MPAEAVPGPGRAEEVVWGAVVGEEMERAGEGTSRGSIEALGRWREEKKNRAMPLKFRAYEDGTDEVRVGFGRFIDELVRQGGASSGILAISTWVETRGESENAVRGFAWSATPDDASYQRYGVVERASKQSGVEAAAEAKRRAKNRTRFADFEGVVDDTGGENQIAVYRVTLPRGGLDPGKWAGRPPPPAPEELYTGPRHDGLLSTDDVSGEYCACCFPFFCSSIVMTPLGANAIETWHTGCVFCPPLAVAPFAGGEALRRTFKGTGNTRLGTNAFGDMTFSADGTVTNENGCCCCYKKCPGSQKRSFQKVETRDLAGKWCSCWCCPFLMPPPLPWPLWSFCCCTTKRALNEDQYAENGTCCWLCLPCPVSEMHTRRYVNGHPTNGFFAAHSNAQRQAQNRDRWHRDPGCAGCNLGFCAKKVC